MASPAQLNNRRLSALVLGTAPGWMACHHQVADGSVPPVGRHPIELRTGVRIDVRVRTCVLYILSTDKHTQAKVIHNLTPIKHMFDTLAPSRRLRANLVHKVAGHRPFSRLQTYPVSTIDGSLRAKTSQRLLTSIDYPMTV